MKNIHRHYTTLCCLCALVLLAVFPATGGEVAPGADGQQTPPTKPQETGPKETKQPEPSKTEVKPAEVKPPEGGVTVKVGKHQGFYRIVFSGDDFVIRNSTATLSESKVIKIEFKLPPADPQKKERPPFFIRTDKGTAKPDVPVEIAKSILLTAKPSGCVITVPGVEDIKVSRLMGPPAPRLIVDARLPAPVKSDTPEAGLPKTAVDQVSLRSFVIDAGHGGYDHGLKGQGFVEKELALSFAKDLAAILSKGGKEVQLTRRGDQVMSLSERIQAVNRKPGDLVISIHVALTRAPRLYSGAEKSGETAEAASGRTYDKKLRDQSRAVALAVAASLQKEFGFDVPSEQLPLPALTRVKAPAILIELPNPSLLAYDKKTRDRLLIAIVRGLAQMKEERPQPLPLPLPQQWDKESKP